MDNMLSVRDMNVFQTMFGPESPFLALATFTSTSATDFTVNGTAAAKPGLGLRWYITDIIFQAGTTFRTNAEGQFITLSTATGTFFQQPLVGATASTTPINNCLHYKFRKPLAVLGYNEKLTGQLSGYNAGSLYVTILGYTGG